VGGYLRDIAERLTYANVVATLALFVALGGASYAAVELPVNSVGPRQLRAGAVTQRALGFPLGLTSLSEKAAGAPRSFCNGGVALAPGEATPPCAPLALGGPAGVRAQVRLKAPGRLVASGVLAIVNRGSTAATVRVAVSFANHPPDFPLNEGTEALGGVQALRLGPGQSIEDPVEAIERAAVGEHLVGLASLVQYAGPGTGEVFTGPGSLAVVTLPDESG